ncbi:MAG TPA: SPOR domain-containing protein [Lentimicrobium sp.]|jgi:hypothetical protein|nr:SPOR domain-containing protein [Lentimicrobium sp.]
MRRYFLLLMILLAGICTHAQEGSVEVIADERIDLLIDKHRYLNRHQSTLEGWRVQIFFDSGANSKRRATEAQKRFSDRYASTKAYLSFKEPYYRVRVGDFRSRLEAEGFLNNIRNDYPNAFTVSDMIDPPPLETKR